MEKNVVIIGLGPHAKRIYMNCFQNNNMEPALFVELKSEEGVVNNYIKEKGLSTRTYFISDSLRDDDELCSEDRYQLLRLVKELNITHAIISTEPKAHYMYLRFFLENCIHILVDKPLTAPKYVSTDISQARNIEDNYKEIVRLYSNAKKNNTILQVQCQRRWHKGYQMVHNLASSIVEKYNIPITALQISHCDGMWNMPDEFVSRENHPYKYGYGKLFHSGYHFIDLVAWFEGINDKLQGKKPNNVELYSAAVRPNDFMHVINNEDYKNILNTEKFNHIFENMSEFEFDKYGEIDIYSIMQFKHDENVISTANISLMQNGFSRRSWEDLPEDTYKGNGRVRHEYVNIEIGPLMNIQIHSYQSKEIKDRVDGKVDIGEVEHFNVYVFRNVDLIGGEPLEKFTLQDLYSNEEIVLGYNESARETCFKEFIQENVIGDPILEHDLGIKILSSEYEALCNKYNGKPPFVKFVIA